MTDVQPSGTVTLVLTDVEGSTKLLEELGTDAYREALGEHRRVVREACARHRGYEVDYEGDAFFHALASAQAAVSAVSEAMVGLSEGPIRIRVGIHTGEPALDPPKYVGMDVHRAARIHERRARRARGVVPLDSLAARAGVIRAARPRGAPVQGFGRSGASVSSWAAASSRRSAASTERIVTSPEEQTRRPRFPVVSIPGASTRGPATADPTT